MPEGALRICNSPPDGKPNPSSLFLGDRRAKPTDQVIVDESLVADLTDDSPAFCQTPNDPAPA